MGDKGMKKQARFANTLVLFVALMTALVLVNIVSVYVSGQVDLTDNNVNSLSPQSVETLQAMLSDDSAKMEVRLYISRNLPDSIKGEWGQDVVLRGVSQKLKDKLEEFRAQSNGRLEVIEVTDDTEKQAEDVGVAPFVAEEATVKEGKLEMTRYVLGATFNWEGEVEVLEKALDPNFFEFEITKRLLRLKDRVENGRKIQHLTKTAEALADAIKKCDDEVRAFEVKEDEKQEISGIEGLLKPIENLEEEVEALAKNHDRVAQQCAQVKTVLESQAAAFKGQNKRFDSLLSGDGPEGSIGGVEAYATTVDGLLEALKEEKPDVQLVAQKKGLLTALKEDIDSYSDQLRKAPGQRRIGFVCGHDEFCPFASMKPVIDPKIAQMMGQQNPIHERFIQVALGLQEQVNQILMSIGNGLFRDRDFEVEKVDATRTIGDDVAALVLFGPRQKLSDREMYEIDQYLVRGGTVLVFASNYDVSLASFSEEQVKKMGPFDPNPQITNDFAELKKNDNNIDDLLTPYGITVNQDLVIDPANTAKITLPHSVRRGRMVISGTKDFDYPMLFYARDFDRTNVVVRSLPGLTLPFASTVDYTAKEGQELEVSKLISSGPTAIALEDPSTLPVKPAGSETGEPLKLLPPDLMAQAQAASPDGPHTLAVMATGKFVSAFKGKEAPAKPPKEPDPENPEPPKEEKEPAKLDEGTGRLLVVGSALGLPPLTLEGIFNGVNIQNITQGEILVPQVRFENWKLKVNQLRRAFSETIPALFNMLDWAVQRAALAEIRAKNNAFRPIERIEEGDQKLVAYAAVGGVPLLFLLFGVGYWQLRLARRRRIARGGDHK